MPNYFLGTSALAKRYHQESGSEYMDRILEQPQSRSPISHLSIVEALDLRYLGHVDMVVAADQRLCRVVSMAGCPAVNPEKAGPVLV